MGLATLEVSLAIAAIRAAASDAIGLPLTACAEGLLAMGIFPATT